MDDTMTVSDALLIVLRGMRDAEWKTWNLAMCLAAAAIVDRHTDDAVARAVARARANDG
jgi:hypothetical protein